MKIRGMTLVAILLICLGCGGSKTPNEGEGIASYTFNATITPIQSSLVTNTIQISYDSTQQGPDSASFESGGVSIITGEKTEGDTKYTILIECFTDDSLIVGEYIIIMQPSTGECRGRLSGAVSHIAQDDNPGSLSVTELDSDSIKGSFDFEAIVGGQEEKVRVEGTFYLPVST